MDATKSYKFIRFGDMDATKPYKFIGFGDMDATKPYKFIGFGDMDDKETHQSKNQKNKLKGTSRPSRVRGLPTLLEPCKDILRATKMITNQNIIPGIRHFTQDVP